MGKSIMNRVNDIENGMEKTATKDDKSEGKEIVNKFNNKLKVNLLAFCTVFFWATAFPLTKIVGEQLSAFTLGFVRTFTASIVLLIIGKILHINKPKTRKDVLLFFIAGTAGFALYITFFTIGIQTLTSATSSIIVAATPILTAIGASKFYKEKIKVVGWCSIATAFIGVIILLLWNGVFSINVGILWTLASAFVFCTYNLLNRKLSAMGYTAVEIVTYAMISGAVVLLCCSANTLSEIASADMSIMALAVYLGIMPSAVAYFLWAKAMSYAEKTSEVTNYMFVTPMLSALMGFMMLSEIPDLGTIIGGIIIIASVIVFNLKGK